LGGGELLVFFEIVLGRLDNSVKAFEEFLGKRFLIEGFRPLGNPGGSIRAFRRPAEQGDIELEQGAIVGTAPCPAEGS
jgi:hypothetical protein